MVEKLTSDQLTVMNLSQLKKYIKSIEEEGYPINYDELKILSNKYTTNDEKLSFLRKKIRHVLRDGIQTKNRSKSGKIKIEKMSVETLNPKQKERYDQLDKLSLKYSKVDPQKIALYDIMKKYKIDGYTKVTTKKEAILSILSAEDSGVSKIDINKDREEIASPKKFSALDDEIKYPSAKKVKKPTVVEPEPEIESEVEVDVEPDPEIEVESEVEEVESKNKLLDTQISKLKKVLQNKGISQPEKAQTEKADQSSECGDMSYDELINKRMSELKKILEMKGIKDSSNLNTKEKAADLICQAKKGKLCSLENNFSCSKGRVCDMTTNPGICVDKGIASKEQDWIEYQGKQIIGNKNAISNLRKYLNLPKFKAPDPFSAEGFVRQKLIQKVVRITGKPKEYFKYMNNNQIEQMIEGHLIEEKRNINRMINFISDEQQIDKEFLSDLSVKELTRRASLIKAQSDEDIKGGNMNREEMIEALSAWTSRNPSTFAQWSDNELNQRLEALRGWNDENPEYWISHKPFPASKVDKKQLISEICQWTGRNPAFYKNWSYEELKERHEALREEFKATKSDKKQLISEISQWTGRNPAFYKNWSYEELKQRHEALRDSFVPSKVDKKQLISEISQWTGTNPAFYKNWNYDELKQRHEALREEFFSSKVNKKQLVSEISQWTGKNPSFYKDWSYEELKQRHEALREEQWLKDSEPQDINKKVEEKKEKTLQEMVEEEIPLESSDEEEEDDKEIRKKQEKIKPEDIEKVLSEIKSGKKVNLQEFDEIQNSVLKCLGLLSA